MPINKLPGLPTRELPLSEKIIGIVGGVGPEAGTLIHRFVIAETPKVKKINCDQDHFMVVHISASPFIADRTDYLLKKYAENAENSAKGVLKVLQILDNIAISQGRKVVVGVPCNTFHSPPIFNELKMMILDNQINNVEVLNMIEETINHIRENYPQADIIGLMSTTGTREQRIYHNLLEPLGFQVIEVDPDIQCELHDTIYNPEFGIKAVSPITSKARDNFQNYADMLINKGAKAIILGCTEIPIALTGESYKGIPLIDPMRALAASLVRQNQS